MVSDQDRFRTKLPQLNTTQPASEVQLQPNGDCLFIRLFSFVLAALLTSPLFGATERRAFLMEPDHCSSSYLYANGERVPVSQAVYKAVCKENNHIRYLARCEKRCMQARYSKCQGDCLMCPWHRMGFFKNLDGIGNTPFLLNRRDMEEEIILRETVRTVYSCADQLVKDGSTILKMRFVCGYSCREIAREMGVSHSCINKRLHMMLTHFHTHAQLFV